MHPKRLVIVVLLLLPASTTSGAAEWSRFGLTLYGVSFHLERRDETGYRFNEINPGLGLQYLFHERGKSEYSLESGILLDSYRRRASYFVLGYRYTLLRNFGVGLVFGLYDSRAVSESGAIVAGAPYLALDFNNATLRFYHLPEFPGINPYPSFAVSIVFSLGPRVSRGINREGS